jgi:hypothetical protein
VNIIWCIWLWPFNHQSNERYEFPISINGYILVKSIQYNGFSVFWGIMNEYYIGISFYFIYSIRRNHEFGNTICKINTQRWSFAHGSQVFSVYFLFSSTTKSLHSKLINNQWKFWGKLNWKYMPNDINNDTIFNTKCSLFFFKIPL